MCIAKLWGRTTPQSERLIRGLSVDRAAFLDRWVDENQHLSAAQDGRVETLPVSDREGFPRNSIFRIVCDLFRVSSMQ
jgi:hypothetical protein